jgi:site-specific DNA recombinase
VIRNPVYCGKIFIPKYKDEESRFAKGQHEPIITEALYYQVQDVLDGRKRGQYRLKVASNATMPLRGFLICPHCGKLLTGSASKGRYKYYSYYHCFDGCTCRFKADYVNNLFEYELKKYIPRPEMMEVYKIALAEAWNDKTNHLQNDRKQLLSQIKELEGKLSYIRDLLSSKQLDPEDFREMKSEYSGKLEKLEAKLSACDDSQVSIDKLLDRGLDNLLKLDYIYETGDIEKKREVIGSMYPEKLTFDGTLLRTTRINEAVRFIYVMNSELGANKNRTNGKKSNLSCQVGVARFELTILARNAPRDTVQDMLIPKSNRNRAAPLDLIFLSRANASVRVFNCDFQISRQGVHSLRDFVSPELCSINRFSKSCVWPV